MSVNAVCPLCNLQSVVVFMFIITAALSCILRYLTMLSIVYAFFFSPVSFFASVVCGILFRNRENHVDPLFKFNES